MRPAHWTRGLVSPTEAPTDRANSQRLLTLELQCTSMRYPALRHSPASLVGRCSLWSWSSLTEARMSGACQRTKHWYAQPCNSLTYIYLFPINMRDRRKANRHVNELPGGAKYTCQHKVYMARVTCLSYVADRFTCLDHI